MPQRDCPRKCHSGKLLSEAGAARALPVTAEEEEFVGDTPNPLSVSQWTSKLRSHSSYLVLGELRGPLLLQPSGLQ